MSEIELLARVGMVLAVPFLAGVWVGVAIINRRKKDLADAEAGLGRLFNQMIDHTSDPLRFTGAGVRVTRQITIKRKGIECKITFEAKGCNP
jgi:hypothetical protein